MVMRKSLLRATPLLWIVVFFATVLTFHGLRSLAAISFEGGGEKQYRVIFGESFHNYLPGSLIKIDVIFISKIANSLKVSQELVVRDQTEKVIWQTRINLDLNSNANTTIPLLIPAPKVSGIFTLTTDHTAVKGDSLGTWFSFKVIQPEKSLRLSKILVYSPESEIGLNAFLKFWNIRAPSVSWGQVLLFGKQSWKRFAEGDQEMIQLVSRSLKREMSVIFLDFGSEGFSEGKPATLSLPYNVSMSLIKNGSSAERFFLKPELRELNYGFSSGNMNKWNGLNGLTIPAEDLRFEGKGMQINALATSGSHPLHYPLVELLPEHGKGKIYISQVITDGRLDEQVKPRRNQPELPAYDPMAVQFLLNLISATVGDNLLK